MASVHDSVTVRPVRHGADTGSAHLWYQLPSEVRPGLNRRPAQVTAYRRLMNSGHICILTLAVLRQTLS